MVVLLEAFRLPCYGLNVFKNLHTEAQTCSVAALENGTSKEIWLNEVVRVGL